MPAQDSCHVTNAQRETILGFDTAKVANAIELLGIRLKNEGFTRPGLVSHCGGARVLGYAVTSKVKCADPPMKGAHSSYDLSSWWRGIEAAPAPRVAVIEDLDERPGAGAVLSDTHAQVLRRLNCGGVVTNGAVRNIDLLRQMEFAAFAGHLGVSHSYVHMVDFECPVRIFGLEVHAHDLVYADAHGMIVLPEDRLDDLISALHRLAAHEARIAELCRANAPLDSIIGAMQTP